MQHEGVMQGTWKHEFHVRENNVRTSSQHYEINAGDQKKRVMIYEISSPLWTGQSSFYLVVKEL